MSAAFAVTASAKPDYFKDNVSKGDVVTYSFDLTPWQADNHTVTSAPWTLEAGNASIGTVTTASGVTSAPVTFASAGRNLISILVTTATEKKKIWLEVLAEDQNIYLDDYGFNNG